MSKKLILIAAGAAVLLGGGGAVAFFALRSPEKHAAEAPKHETEKPAIVSMEPFLFNINDPKADRFAKVTVQLMVLPLSAAEAIGEDEALKAQMRDRILTLLTSKAPEDLLGPVGKEALRREIKTTLASVVKEGEIQEVLFADFVVQ